MIKIVRGYKIFNSDWTCRDKQYVCPGKFEEDLLPVICERGMHFCKRASDCFKYYSFKTPYHIAEVIAYGNIVEKGNKCATDKLEIVREIPWTELLEIIFAESRYGWYLDNGNLNNRNNYKVFDRNYKTRCIIENDIPNRISIIPLKGDRYYVQEKMEARQVLNGIVQVPDKHY